jgi:hypothetical protein
MLERFGGDREIGVAGGRTAGDLRRRPLIQMQRYVRISLGIRR